MDVQRGAEVSPALRSDQSQTLSPSPPISPLLSHVFFLSLFTVCRNTKLTLQVERVMKAFKLK